MGISLTLLCLLFVSLSSLAFRSAIRFILLRDAASPPPPCSADGRGRSLNISRSERGDVDFRMLFVGGLDDEGVFLAVLDRDVGGDGREGSGRSSKCAFLAFDRGSFAIAMRAISCAALLVGVSLGLLDAGIFRGAGASRSSSSSSPVVAVASSADCCGVVCLAALLLDVRSKGRAVGGGRLSGFEYPAAARVFDLTPCRPVKEVRSLRGLVMSPCNVVPTQGSSSLVTSRSDSSLSLSVRGLLAAACAWICWRADFCFDALASAAFLLFVSSRMAVMESTGRDMVVIAEAFWTLARFLRRMYSA